jgi:nucleotide-binding universal stress UspA family protein
MALRILLATDASTDARAAARWLTHLPLPADTALDLLHVELPLPAVAGLPVAFVQEVERAAASAAQACLRETAAALGPRGAAAGRLLRRGQPSAEIIEAIEQRGSDLVVLGARGQSAMAASVLGSVAQDVTRHAPCSVLVVRGDGAPPRRVLVAVDGSPHAARAARFSEWLPLPHGAELYVVAVVQPYEPHGAPPAAGSPLAGALAAIRREQWAIATRAAAEARHWLGARGWSVDEPHVVEGHPAAEILRHATAIEADLVVVGWRGWRPGQGVLPGTVARKVVRYAPCPVLVVKERPPVP